MKSKMKLAGIVGDPLGHSVSPAMHNAAFRKAKIQAMYLPFEVNEFGFEASMMGFRAVSLLGLNITVPYKQAALSYMDQLDAFAQETGAMNTVVVRGKKWVGYNTDGDGFWRALPGPWQSSIRGSEILLLGSGGTARSLAAIAARKGAKVIFVANRTSRRASKLAGEISGWKYRVTCEVIGWNTQAIKKIIPRVKVILNATSSGLRSADSLPLPVQKGIRGLRVFDVLYHTKSTPLLKWAGSHGVPALGGAEMLVQQGALAWSLWTGRPAPVALMRQTVHRALAHLKIRQ